VDEVVTWPAAPSLRRFVGRYWGYRARPGIPERRRESLSADVVLILGLDTELGVVDRRQPGERAPRYRSFVGGPDDACPVIEHDGEMAGVQVDLTPLAARMIFREPMHGLAREIVRLEDLLGPDAGRLEERLHAATSWNERFDLVEDVLARRLDAATPPPADVEWAWRRLNATHGQLTVTELAAELRCSRKHLASRFREHVGLPPKLVARMLRFRRAADLLLERPELSLADVAFACGYYDQAHLDRDFRDFAQTTPTAYAVTSVQDAAAQLS
jgi:AraC-like DNA-binding protein